MKTEKTYVHRRDGSSFPASISDVAAQRYFYSRLSRDGSKTLDDLITNYENRLGGLLINLRAVSIDGAVNAGVAAEVIAHLTPRSAHMRRSFSSVMEKFVKAATEAFSDEDTVVQMSGLAEPEPNQIWNEHIASVLDKELHLKTLLELLSIPKSLLDRMIFMAAKEHVVGSFDAKTWGVTDAFTSVLDRLHDLVRDGHNKALGQALIAEPRKTSLEALEWHIRAAPPEGAILPDCVALGADEEGGPFLPYMMTTMATVSAVVMPITSEKLLVGVRPGRDAPDLANFNCDAAACSDELFITASQSPFFAQLGAKMGQRWRTKIDAVVQAALKDVLPNKRLSDESGSDRPTLPPVSYQLTFTNLGTEEEVRPISEMTQRLLEHVRPLFDLERLDGITFAADHQGALNDLERSFDIDTTPEGVPDYIAQGAATALVLRDGVAKVRIVMHAAYGQSLIADEQEHAEMALHFLVAGLVQACTLSQIEKALPSFLLEPVLMTDHDGVLHCAVRKAVRAYRYARDSAQFGADAMVQQEFSKYLINSFDNASVTIANAKEEHADSPDYPKLFETAHGAASEMLISTARLLGHRHGTSRLDFSTSESDVRATLAARQLTSWIEVFSKDLQRFWQKETWTRTDFYALNIHVERVLWANGIVLWREPNGHGTMIMAAPSQLAPQP
ncbi:MAG: hypothetical protein IPM60_06460 [Rhodospirillales bacterium]|nr:hypothetical protein [Rhodospirillales bacterium]